MDSSYIRGILAISLIFMIIHTLGYDNLPKGTKSVLEGISRKIKRLRLQNPIITLKYVQIPGEEQRENAILEWLHR